MNPLNQNLSLTFKPSGASNWSPGRLGKLKANALGASGSFSTPQQFETFTAGHQTSGSTAPHSKTPASSNWGSPGEIVTSTPSESGPTPEAETSNKAFSLAQPQISNETPAAGACMGPLLCEQEPLLQTQREPSTETKAKGPSPQFLANLAAENQSTMLNTWKTMAEMRAEDRTTGASIADINAAAAQEISDMQMQGYLQRVDLQNKANQQFVYLFSEEWPDP